MLPEARDSPGGSHRACSLRSAARTAISDFQPPEYTREKLSVALIKATSLVINVTPGGPLAKTALPGQAAQV